MWRYAEYWWPLAVIVGVGVGMAALIMVAVNSCGSRGPARISPSGPGVVRFESFARVFVEELSSAYNARAKEMAESAGLSAQDVKAVKVGYDLAGIDHRTTASLMYPVVWVATVEEIVSNIVLRDGQYGGGGYVSYRNEFVFHWDGKRFVGLESTRIQRYPENRMVGVVTFREGRHVDAVAKKANERWLNQN